MVQRCIVTPGNDFTVNCDPGSSLNVELWPRVMVQRWIVNPVLIPRLIVSRGWGHNSTWNSDPGSQFNLEFWPGVTFWSIYISSTRGIATTRRCQHSTAKKGHNSTKIHWILTPGHYSIGVHILSYTGTAYPHLILSWPQMAFVGRLEILYKQQPMKYPLLWGFLSLHGISRSLELKTVQFLWKNPDY